MTTSDLSKAPQNGMAGHAERRSTAIIALGSNLGSSTSTLISAISQVEREIGPVSAISRFYRSAPLTLSGEPESQPEYLNAALSCVTTLAPPMILARLLEIEQRLGRDRSSAQRWTPRIIDLDLIFVGNQILTQPGLKLPHPEAAKRDFVLRPICDFAPGFIHPELKLTVEELLHKLETEGASLFINLT
ncbi:MAG: 2-amino-4-hydroxy-6-hydroxymethyldihydropteridine diphosphokinase [Oligoflexia bacterium]|nr:2-amino-4-hydroxy-6-hydroxymethyldihydropteridine diphosphokinase [Oligoflexia bacterium]